MAFPGGGGGVAAAAACVEKRSRAYFSASRFVAGCGVYHGTRRTWPGTSSPSPRRAHLSTKAPPLQPDRASHIVVAEVYVGSVAASHRRCEAKRSNVLLTVRLQPRSAVPQNWIHATGADGAQSSGRRSMLPDTAATPLKASAASHAKRCIIMPPIEKPSAATRAGSAQAAATRWPLAARAMATSSMRDTRGARDVLLPVFHMHGRSESNLSPFAQQASSQPTGQQSSLSKVGLVPKGNPTTMP
mmetsp:Transcript_49445/g.150455  ORF Transcript_49445/g.150455 Transcript_49445/m.150455 type:complete len:244 (+) Transcript_49445:139-870(+)